MLGGALQQSKTSVDLAARLVAALSMLNDDIKSDSGSYAVNKVVGE